MAGQIAQKTRGKDRTGILPNLIIIGAQKCGTTSLHYYLGLHPQISMSREKEVDFFSFDHNWRKGVDWYKSHFEGKAAVHGESSPNYSTYPGLDNVPKRMHSVIPDTKLVYILRDPIDRIISHYVQNCATGYEDRSLEDALQSLDVSTPYIRRSCYFMQLEQYLKYFPSSRILIITAEDLYAKRQETLQDVFAFLGVDETFYSEKFQTIKHGSVGKGRKNRLGLLLRRLSEMHVGKLFSTDLRMKLGALLYLPFSTEIERPTMDERLRKRLIQRLEDDVNRLREHTGRDFEEWCL